MNAWVRWWDRLLGYEICGGWRLYPTDPADRRKHGLPERIPVPREEWRTWAKGLEVGRLPHERMARFAERFAAERPRHRLSESLAHFARKAPLAQQVEQALHEREWARAEALLGSVLEIDPADGRARMLRGLCLQNLGRLAEAETAYAAAEPLVGASADLEALRAGLLEVRGRADEALAAYRRALELESGHPLALGRLAALGELVEIYLGDLDHPEKAYLTREAYHQLVSDGWEKGPQSLVFYLERSEFHLRRGQPALALAAAERAAAVLAAGPPEAPLGRQGQASVEAARCRALIALERTSEAAESIGRLQALAPESEATLSCLGQLLWFQGDRAQAAQVLTRALAANPNRIENVQIYLSPEFPRPDRDPLRAIERLMAVHPEAPTLHALAGSLHMAAGDWEKGERHALCAAAGGADDQFLLELTGRLGRAGRHAAVARLVEGAGGWERFLAAGAMVRSNVAASLRAEGRDQEAEALWRSVVADEQAHPDVRLRARALLGARESEEAPH